MTREVCSCLLSLLVLAGCSTKRDEDPSRPRLEVGYSALRISLPVLVAQARGLYAAHGLDVTLKRYDTAQPLVEELLDGRVLAGGYAALPIVFGAAAKSSTRLSLVGALIEDQAHPVSYLLRKPGDTSLQRIADLRGKRIGVLPTLAYQRWLSAILASAGLSATEVTVVSVAPPMQVAALTEGVVDALFTGDPMATTALATQRAEHFGPAAPLTSVTGKPLWFGSFLVHPKLIAARPNDVTALVRALDDAVRFIHEHQAEARALLAPFLRDAERPYVSKYPDARFLRSDELDEAQLGAALALQVSLGALQATPEVAGRVFHQGERR